MKILMMCVVLANVQSGEKIVEVRDLRMRASGGAFRVMDCKPVERKVETVQEMVVDNSKPLRRFK